MERMEARERRGRPSLVGSHVRRHHIYLGRGLELRHLILDGLVDDLALQVVADVLLHLLEGVLGRVLALTTTFGSGSCVVSSTSCRIAT